MAVAPGFGGRSVGGFKSTFFDADVVLRAMDRTTRKALSKAGAFIRQRARTSIRKAPKADVRTGRVLKGRRKKGMAVTDAVAPPGQPPFGHGDQKLKRLIFFAYEPEAQTVVIGPAKFQSQRGGGPEFLEYGGNTTIRNRRGKARREVFRGNPFMNPAMEAEMPNVMKFFEEAGF
jgi:hypothetical protein